MMILKVLVMWMMDDNCFLMKMKVVLLLLHLTVTATVSVVSTLNFNYRCYWSNFYYYFSISRQCGLMSNNPREDPVNYFNQLWINTISNEILHQTNLYSQHYISYHDDHLQHHPTPSLHDFTNHQFILGELYIF